MFNLVYNNHRITFGNVNVGYEIPYASITYSTVDHGTVSGIATAQIGSTVTVTATPSSGYTLSYVTVNGVQIAGTSFVVTGNTVVGAVFTQIVYAITYDSASSEHCTVTGPASATAGTIINVTATPDTGYVLSYITVNGTQIEGTSFTMPSANVTVTALAEYVDPYNPLDLPANTIRCKFTTGYTPTMGDTQILVDANSNVWDIYSSSNDWSNLFDEGSKEHTLLEVLGANTSNVTNMSNMFYRCSSLTTTSLFDTSNVTDMMYMFAYCVALTNVPLFDTSNVIKLQGMLCECTSLTLIPLFDVTKATSMNSMFYNCVNVESGALALYQEASSKAIEVVYKQYCFYRCGYNTTTGNAERLQIPSDWR